MRLLGRCHAGVAVGLGRRLVRRWCNRGAGLVVLVVGPVLPLGRRWCNPGVAVGLAVPAPWAPPIAEKGKAG